MLFVFSKASIPLALQPLHTHCSTKLDRTRSIKLAKWAKKSAREGYPRCARSSVIQFYWDLEWFAPGSPREINTLINVILGREVPQTPPPRILRERHCLTNKNKKSSDDGETCTVATNQPAHFYRFPADLVYLLITQLNNTISVLISMCNTV